MGDQKNVFLKKNNWERIISFYIYQHSEKNIEKIDERVRIKYYFIKAHKNWVKNREYKWIFWELVQIVLFIR